MKKNQFHHMLDDIKNQIHNERWEKGERIPTLTELSKAYNVSVSTAREVLRVLENRGYITIQQGRGTFISSQLPEDVQTVSSSSVFNLLQLSEFRMMVEPQFAELAAKQAFPKEIDAIFQSATYMDELVQKDLPTVEEDMRFHSLIAYATHNDYAIDAYKNIQPQLKEGREYTNIQGMKGKASHYHTMIADSIKTRNAEKAKLYMQFHMEANREFALYELTNNTPKSYR